MRRRKAHGLSIIEVLISFTVLTVAILALLGVLPAAGRQGMSTDIQNQAMFIAQQTMDDILLKQTVTGDYPQSLLSEQPTLQMQLNATTAPLAQGYGNLDQVTVEVTWLEQGRARSVRLVSAVRPAPKE